MADDLARAFLAVEELRERVGAIPREELEELIADAPIEHAPGREHERWFDRWLEPRGITCELIERVIGAPAGAIEEVEADRRLEQFLGPAFDDALNSR